MKEEALRRAEQQGIVFIDEIDKIAGRSTGQGPDVSREGVQRDILPIVEGSTVNTKHGAVKTDFMLFIAAGAFHVAKVSDLIPELQGRFPVHVKLHSRTREDFIKILTQPDNALTRQYIKLFELDKIDLRFTTNALKAIARKSIERKTGARGLRSIVEAIMIDIMFELPSIEGEKQVVVNLDVIMNSSKPEIQYKKKSA